MKAMHRGALGCLLLSLTTLATVGEPKLVQAQEPVPLPPEGEELVDPIGSDACASAGFGTVVFVAVVVEGGLDSSTADPVNDAVGATCQSFSPPQDEVACPADDELQNQIFALPAQDAVPLPPPPVTIFGASIETLRALTALADRSPDTVDPVAALLECTTIPGRGGTRGPLPPPTEPPSSTTVPTSTVTTPSPATPPTPNPSAPVPQRSDEVALAPSPTVSDNPAPASFIPFEPTLPAEAQLLAVFAALTLLSTARWAWRRAGRHAVAAVFPGGRD